MSQEAIITENFDEESKKFIVEDYKLKVAYLQSHFSRMWTRFNFFLTIELALFGFFGYLLFDTKSNSVEAIIGPIILGLLTSILWYFVGSQDRYLVESYREDVKGIARIIADLQDGLAWYADYYVGSRRKLPQPFGSDVPKSGGDM